MSNSSCDRSVRIVSADYYLTKPLSKLGDPCYSGFRSLPVYQVPIIRIFGSTSEGVKTCVHVHGVFPYLFIPNHNLQDKDLYHLAVELDKAINASFPYNNSKNVHVYKITIVSGRPFYGYHSEENEFLKIEFYNPAIVKRATDLLQNGALHNTILQPHEAHIPYILQFFIDNNLYGMSNITFSAYSVRTEVCENQHITVNDYNVPKQSHCKFEVDILVTNLSSISSIEGSAPNNPGLAFIWEEEKRRRRGQDRSSQITINESQPRPENMSTSSEQYFKRKLREKLQALDNEYAVSENESEADLSLNTAYEELNSQSKSIVQLLEKLCEEQATTCTKNKNLNCASTSNAVEENEDDCANLSVLSSQPLFKLDAEADSILGDNFSEEENEIDDNDHYNLSQAMAYSKDGHLSSDDSDFENLVDQIPQLDGANELPFEGRRRTRRLKESDSSKKHGSDLTTQNNKKKRSYNLRSNQKADNKTVSSTSLKGQDFNILLDPVDCNKVTPSPRKSYPRLGIDIQKSPKSSNIQTSSTKSLTEDPKSPQSKSVAEPEPKKNEKRCYPQLGINVEKSPKTLHQQKPKDKSSLRKRKIDFGKSAETPNVVSDPDADSDMTSIISKWKNSFKRKRTDQSSLAEKSVRSSVTTNDSVTLSETQISSQKYSLRVNTNCEEYAEFNNLSVEIECADVSHLKTECLTQAVPSSDAADLEQCAPSPEILPPSVSAVAEPARKDSFSFNNSIWESANEYDESCIKSFYGDTTHTSAEITVVEDVETDNTSPLARSLDNEIVSFYGSQSPVSSIHTDAESDKLSQNSDKSENFVECSQPTAKTGTMMGGLADDSPPVEGVVKANIQHSTPRGVGSKKSPSPTCTPILKKLMMKKFGEKSVKSRSRMSAQRFKSEPFLPDIQEVEEKKGEDDVKNTSFSLPTMPSTEIETAVSKEETARCKSQNTSRSSNCSGPSFHIDEATLPNSGGFKIDLENLQDIKTDVQYHFLTLISMEVFVQTRLELNPDPEFDPICCIFYTIMQDAPDVPNLKSGIIVINEYSPNSLDISKFNCDKIFVEDENELFEKFIHTIREWDPDMLIGYEVEMLSWGYFIQRGHFLGRNCAQQLSRVKETTEKRNREKEDGYSNEIKIIGRIVLNVWRLMRHEVALQSYTFENIMYHVLHQRVPQHSFHFLTNCWKTPMQRWIVVDYYLYRAECNLKILDQLDFVGRTSELAKLFGIQFYEVLSRGSQFRVESMMLRMAKKRNYVAVSPSFKQRAAMRAPESLPLIMEPESKFYTDPVIVLDFQSLYPSIIIAYNYCFSTCLGRVEYLAESETFRFGCTELTVPVSLVRKLEASLSMSPVGVAFVDKSIRTGILPTMLEEILETRLMVKKSLKENKDNSTLKRVLHARQLGLKLIANVTYGYTSANFSGRMPCMEIGDSVVSKGRETLERAIKLVSETKKWGARVVYGDTDSIFVLVPNRTKEEAFQIGSEIADAVTSANPKPVKLKLEKVYLPCILQTKKRYCGYMYESADQEKPTYDAKGIETVRRDGCPAVSKILEKSLKLLFETQNVNVVKQYVQRQFSKIISGRLSIQELTYAREYRGMNNYKEAACVPALQLAKQALLRDRRAEPRIKERVRYVLVAGPPGVPLIRLVRTPEQFLSTPGSLINGEYYITRAIVPALDRCFSLMNVNVMSWYSDLPRKLKLSMMSKCEYTVNLQKKKTISQYFGSNKCISCSKLATAGVCKQCERKPQQLAVVLANMVNSWQRKHNYISKVCRSCCGRSDAFECISLDCPVYYLSRQAEQDMKQVSYVEELQYKYLRF